MFHGALHAACCRIACPTRRVAHSAGLRRCLVVPGVCAVPPVVRSPIGRRIASVVCCMQTIVACCMQAMPLCLFGDCSLHQSTPSMLYAIRCTLRVAHCTLRVAHCMLHVARCMLSVACCAAAHERQCVKIKTSAAACHSSTVERAKTSPAPCVRKPGWRACARCGHKVSGRCGRVQRYLKRAHDHALLPEPRTPTATAPSATPACGRNPHRTCVRAQVRT
jgi:hypothetical protein